MNLYKITLTSKTTFKGFIQYVMAEDLETAQCFAEEQANAYGAIGEAYNAYFDEIPNDYNKDSIPTIKV